MGILYDEDPIEGNMVPQKLNIHFGPGVIRWDKAYYYQQLECPFQRRTPADYYDEDVQSITISQGELLRNESRPGCFGVYLPAVKEQIERQRAEARRQFGTPDNEPFDYNAIQQFIIQIADIEEIMQMDTRPYFEWR